jgi:uncharacterized membrane protein
MDDIYTEVPHIAASPVPQVADLAVADLKAALVAGWQDFRAAPRFGLVFAAIYVSGGWLLYLFLAVTGQIWWALPITLGFPLLGPFAAVGLYEASRRLSRGVALDWRGIFGVILAQRFRQLPTMAWVVLIFFLFWNFLAHMLFALFMGLDAMVNVTTSLSYLWSVNGITMLVVGTAVGAVLSSLLFALTAFSLPLLLDKELDFVTAMIVSVQCATRNLPVMLGWGAFIATALFIGMLPGFLGLFVVLPVLGHASWHLYTRALVHPA